MLTEQIVKDVFEIHSRLFDHRPVLQGHIRAFVREFDERRENREAERLEKTHVLVTEMSSNYVEETRKALDTFLPNIQGKLEVAIEVCKKLEEKENNVEVGYLDLQRQTRRKAWDEFMQQQFDRSAKVDQDMDEEMQKIAAEYAALEKNLDNTAAN